MNDLPGVVDYDEAMAPYHAQLTPEDRARRDVFRQAYSLAMQVIELREQHGLTQAQLAERCGMDQADISRIERGAVSPTARTLQRVADALDADLRLVARPPEHPRRTAESGRLSQSSRSSGSSSVTTRRG